MTVEPTLDDAHRLLREGRVDSAIDAYAALLKERPDDWTTANRLGDLYVQTGQMDKAVEQFTHVAHCLVTRTLLPKAAALYKKVLKVVPGDESTRSQLVDLALRQGFRVEAIGHLRAMAEQRRATGDDAGALEVQHRIDSLRRPALDATEEAPAERMARDATQLARAILPTGPDAREEATAAREATRPASTTAVTQSEGRVEPTAPDRQRQLKLQLIEDEVRAGRLKRARQLVLVVLSEASDATEHILDLAKRLTAETGDATVMCADALLEAARRGQAPPTNIAAVRSLAAWVPAQPEGSQWPAGRLDRLARIDAAAALELAPEERHALVEIGPELTTGAEANTSCAPSPAPPFTSAVAAAV